MTGDPHVHADGDNITILPDRLVHGRRSPRKKAERLAERRAKEAEERARFAAWVAPIEAACRRQHAEVMEQIRRERAERALERPDLWPPID